MTDVVWSLLHFISLSELEELVSC